MRTHIAWFYEFNIGIFNLNVILTRTFCYHHNFFCCLSLTYLIIPEVDPAKSLALITSGGHSGWAIIFIPGLFFLISLISFSLNWSWTIQIPFHEIISTSVCEATYFAR